MTLPTLAYLELGPRHFLPCGHMPLLDQQGDLTRRLALAIAQAHLCPEPLVLFGHAEAQEVEPGLGIRRASMVRSLLLQDPQTWKLGALTATPGELLGMLGGIAATMGWDCCAVDDGFWPRASSSSLAIQNFQLQCRHRYRTPMVPDGRITPFVWNGVYEVLQEQIRQTLRHRSLHLLTETGRWSPWNLGGPHQRGIVGCGQPFSRLHPGRTSRRVDLVFGPYFPANCVQPPWEWSLYDLEKYRWVEVEG